VGKASELGIVDSMAQMTFAVHGFLEQRASENGLSIIQTRLLGVLRDRKPAMNELARLLELDKSSVTGLVDRAERRGLVVRVPSETDGRAVLVHLTREGRTLGARIASGFEADISEFLGSLSRPEQRVLSELATRALVARATGKGVDIFVGKVKD
jgi:MarR family transcriptional regulator, lower aerobic nicotinate degradation pathway regulator